MTWHLKMEAANSSERSINVYQLTEHCAPKEMNLNCPLVRFICVQQNLALKTYGLWHQSDICIQLAWKPHILFTCYLFMTHTCTCIHMLILFAYSMSHIKWISNNREKAVSVQYSFKSISRHLKNLHNCKTTLLYSGCQKEMLHQNIQLSMSRCFEYKYTTL